MTTQSNLSDEMSAQLNQVDKLNPEGEPAYVLRRSFDMKGQSMYTIWVKEDSMKISSVKLSQLLANILSSQVKVTDLPTNSPDDSTKVMKEAR